MKFKPPKPGGNKDKYPECGYVVRCPGKITRDISFTEFGQVTAEDGFNDELSLILQNGATELGDRTAFKQIFPTNSNEKDQVLDERSLPLKNLK